MLEMPEEEPDLPSREPVETRSRPTRPPRKSANWSIDETQEQRGRFRAAAEDGRGVARPFRGAHAALARRRWKKRASASSTRWRTWSPGRNRCRIICPISSAGSIWSRQLRAMAERIIYNLDTNGYLQGRLEDLLGPDATPRTISRWPSRRWPWCKSSIRRASPPATCANACCCSSRRACRIYEELQDAHLQPSGRPRTQPAAGDLAEDGLFDRADPGGARRAAQAQSQAGRRFPRGVRPHRHAGRVRRTGRRRRLPGAARRRPACPACTSARTTASCCNEQDTPRKPASTSSGRSTRRSG